MGISSRQATEADIPLLGELNHQLIRDEGHRNPMTMAQLQERMRDWLAGKYAATLFEDEGRVVAYALYRKEPALIYLRQFFVQRDQRRKGYGKRAIQLLRDQIWPKDKRLVVEVLSSNEGGISFWKTVGFHEYSMTLEIMPVVK
jgi:GNAT superfamily N-acetyltransferase